MILASLNQWDVYAAQLPAAVVRAITALRAMNPATLTPGRYPIAGSESYVLIQEMDSAPLEATRHEVHHGYADVQMLFEGAERYGWAPADPTVLPVEDNFEGSDIAFYPVPPCESFLDLGPGMFLVFHPGEFHRPRIAIGKPAHLRKAVIKIPASEL